MSAVFYQGYFVSPVYNAIYKPRTVRKCGISHMLHKPSIAAEDFRKIADIQVVSP